MRNNAQASADDIDIVEVFAAIKRNIIKLIAASLLVGAATFVVLTKMTPKYNAVAQLQFGGRAVVSQVGNSAARNVGANDVLLKVDKEAVASQVAVIKSRDLAIELIEDLNLKQNREFNSALGGGSLVAKVLHQMGLSGSDANITADDRVLAQYDKALKVYQGKDTRVISIEFTSSDPKLSARAANKLAQLYLAGRVTRTVRQSVNASSYLKPEIAKLQRQVQIAESVVEEYRGRHNLFEGGGASQRGTLNNEQLSELTRELTRAQTVRSEADARAKTIRELMLRGSADASPDVMRSPLMQRLQDQRVRVERQVSELSATLLPAHPRMKQLRADLRGLNRQLRAQVSKIVDSMSKEATVAARRVASIQRSVDDLKSQVRNSGGKRAKLAELKRDAKAKRQQLEQLLARYQNALARQQYSAVPLEAELFSKARASTIPSVKRGPLSALAMAATFLLGLALVVTKELLSGSRSGGGASAGYGRRASDRQMPAQPALGAAPQTQATATGAGSAAPAAGSAAAVTGIAAAAAATQKNTTPDAALVEAAPHNDDIESPVILSCIASVANYMQGQKKDAQGYRVMAASATDGNASAAKQAIELATRLGAKGAQVILLDWCPNGSGLAYYLKQLSHPGLSELLQDTASFEQVIKRLSDSQVHFIASGADQPAGASNLDQERLNLILDALDEAYDYIVVYGDNSAARELFLATEGRFDAGITIVGDGKKTATAVDGPGVFLGFEVTDLDIIRCKSDAVSAVQPARSTTPGRSEARL